MQRRGILATSDVRRRAAQDLPAAGIVAEHAAALARSQRDRAIAHESLGDVYVTQGAYARAQHEYEARLRIFSQLAASSPDSADIQERDFPQAADHFASALAIDRHLAAENPDDATHRRDVALDLGLKIRWRAAAKAGQTPA